MNKKLLTLFLSAIACCGLALAACNIEEENSSISSASSIESVESNSISTTSSTEKETDEGSNGLIYSLIKSDGQYVYTVTGYVNQPDETEIVIPSSIEGKPVIAISKHAFEYGTFTRIEIPESVTFIGYGAFSYCENLTDITIPNGVTSLGTSIFSNCNNLTNITIPNSVTSIGAAAFNNCSSLTSVTIPDSVISIENGAFYACRSLTNVVIPENVTSIGDSAFSNCTNLTNVVIPDSVTSISNYAFSGCTNLTSVTIPSGITSIGSNAFDYCYKLVEVINKSSLTITAGDYTNGYVGRYAKQIITEEKDSKLTQEGDYIFYNDNGNYYLVNYVGKDAEIVLPSNINGSTYTLNSYAFAYCGKLTSVTLSNGVTAIGESTFERCTSLKSVIIEQGTTSIGNSAFSYCACLKSIVIPNSVTSIGDSAFIGSILTSVYYKGTSEQWATIDIPLWNSVNLANATRYYYSESNPTEEGNYWHYVDGVATPWQ